MDKKKVIELIQEVISNNVDNLESNLGKSISIKLVAVGVSDKAMTFKVEGVDNIFANEVPHITIATFRGGNPVDSNRIIYWRCIEPVIITAKLEKR